MIEFFDTVKESETAAGKKVSMTTSSVYKEGIFVGTLEELIGKLHDVKERDFRYFDMLGQQHFYKDGRYDLAQEISLQDAKDALVEYAKSNLLVKVGERRVAVKVTEFSGKVSWVFVAGDRPLTRRTAALIERCEVDDSLFENLKKTHPSRDFAGIEIIELQPIHPLLLCQETDNVN